MKKKYAELSRTGNPGPDNRVDEKIMQVMTDEVHIMGDTTGSSTSGIEVRGKYQSRKFFLQVSMSNLVHRWVGVLCIWVLWEKKERPSQVFCYGNNPLLR